MNIFSGNSGFRLDPKALLAGMAARVADGLGEEKVEEIRQITERISTRDEKKIANIAAISAVMIRIGATDYASVIAATYLDGYMAGRDDAFGELGNPLTGKADSAE